MRTGGGTPCQSMFATSAEGTPHPPHQRHHDGGHRQHRPDPNGIASNMPAIRPQNTLWNRANPERRTRNTGLPELICGGAPTLVAGAGSADSLGAIAKGSGAASIWGEVTGALMRLRSSDDRAFSQDSPKGRGLTSLKLPLVLFRSLQEAPRATPCAARRKLIAGGER